MREEQSDDSLSKIVTKRIKNYLINDREYKMFSREIERLGYQADFMVIDESYSYITYPDKNSETVSEGRWMPITKGYMLDTRKLQGNIIAKSREVLFDKEKGETNFISLFEKTENVKRTEAFFEKNKIDYTLSRNEDAHDCVQAAKVRYRLDDLKIDTHAELKTIFGYYKKGNGEKHLVVLNCPGDKNIKWKSVKDILPLDDIKKEEELLKNFKIQFATVNPFLISIVFDNTPAIRGEYKTLTILYDESLNRIATTMHTNAGELSWGIEFQINDVMKISDSRFIYGKSFIQ